MDEYEEERRAPNRLTDKQVSYIVDKVIDKLETRANRMGFRALVGVIGVFLTVFITWLSGKIHIRIDP